MKRKRIQWFALLLAGCMTAGMLRAQENEAWWMKGFVDTYHAIRTDRPNDWMSSRTRLRGEIARQTGGSSLFVSFNAVYNTLLKERTGFQLREAYLDHQTRNWGIRAGRQLVIWGAADGIRITDLVSPMDMTEFLAQDYDDIRMPVDAFRFFLFNETVKFETILVPTFQSYTLPTDSENPWSVLPVDMQIPIVWNDRQYRPAFNWANIEYGGRLSVTLPGIDFSVAALHTWNKMPVLEYAFLQQQITVSPRYYRMGFVGGDVAKPAGQFVFRGEAAFNIGKHFSYSPMHQTNRQKGFNSLHWLVAADWYAPGEWTVMLQFSSESIFNYRTFIDRPEHYSLATIHLSKRLFNGTLQLSDFVYADLSHKGWFSRFTADYALSDQIHLLAGYDWFGGGDKGIFGRFRKNSEIWFKAKYSF